MHENGEVYDFGLRLKSLRKAAKLTLKDVAGRLGVSEGAVVRYENNTLLPPVDKLDLMAVMYRTSIDYMRNLDKRPSVYLGDLTAEQQRIVMTVLDALRASFASTNEPLQ